MKRYDSYKDSGVEWIGEVPSHWEVMKSSLIYNNIGSGTTPSSSNPLFYTEDSDGFFWLQTGDLNDGIISDTSKKVTKLAVNEYKLKFYPANSVVIAMYGATIGKIGLLKIETSTNQACCVLPKSKKMKELFSFYLYQAAKQPMILEAMGGGQPNISQDTVKKLRIPVPPLPEQQEIASYLNKRCKEIDKAIAKQQKRIELLQELRQSIITNAVTRGINPDAPLKDSGVEWIGEVPEHWNIRKLKFICKSEKYSIKTGPFGTQLKGQDLQIEGDVRVYNQRNVIDNQFDSVSYYISNDKAKELKSFYTKPMDLLITSRGTIGKCATLPQNASMGILHPCLIALRIDLSVCDIRWVQLFVGESSCFATNIFLNSNATTIEVIYTDTIKNVEIPTPPLQEQQQIVDCIEKQIVRFDKAIAKAEYRIGLLQELKQSIITEVVTGKRKVC